MLTKTIFASSISDEINTGNAVSKEQAEMLFAFLRDCSLFRWFDANNDCEDRANAICIMLDKWNIANCKGWVFSGYVFNKIGFLKNLWVYHVAASIPVVEENEVHYYMIDPATTTQLQTVEYWAANVTDNPHSYYAIKDGDYYIYHPQNIRKTNWFRRNKRNYNWTIQGLSGINGVSSRGKAQLSFNKRKVKRTELAFRELMKTKPSFLLT